MKASLPEARAARLPTARRAWAWAQALTYLALVVTGALALLPFLWLVRSSLMDNAQIFAAPPQWLPRPFAWHNYVESLTGQPFGRYLVNTLTIAALAVPGTLITSALAAFSFSRLQWRGRNLAFGLLLSGLMLPYAVTLIPTFALWQRLGAIDTFWPLTVPAWFGGGAFNIFLLRQFFLTIPRELDEAAYLDGASPLQVLWRVVLPLSVPALVVVGIFSFIAVWNDFLGPLIYLSSEDHFTLTLGLATFKGTYTAQWGYLMAAATAVVAPIVALFFFAQRYFIEGITMTGVKG